MKMSNVTHLLCGFFFPFLKYVCFDLVAEGVTACYLICGTGAHKRMTNPIYWNFTVFIKATVSISSFIVKAKHQLAN